MKSGQRLRLDLGLLAEHHKTIQNRVLRHDDLDVGGALCEVLQASNGQNRVICGINKCAEILRSEPESLMMCILPYVTSCSDIVLQIHLTLIKAFCLEQDIKLIQIDDTEQLQKIISGTNCSHTMTGNDVAASDESSDFNCVLIQYPSGDNSAAESALLSFLAATCDFSPQPIVQLHLLDATQSEIRRRRTTTRRKLNDAPENVAACRHPVVGICIDGHEVLSSPFSWPCTAGGIAHQSIIDPAASKFVSPAVVTHRWPKEIS